MKKINLTHFLVAIVFVAMSACTKTESCECSYTDVSGEKITQSAVELKGSKKKIKEACDSKSKEWAGANGSCLIK